MDEIIVYGILAACTIFCSVANIINVIKINKSSKRIDRMIKGRRKQWNWWE